MNFFAPPPVSTYRFSQWLFGIAWNVMRDHWARVVEPADVDLAAMPSAERSAEERVVEAARARRLRELWGGSRIGHFPEIFRRTVRERDGERLHEFRTKRRMTIQALAESGGDVADVRQ